MATDKRHLLLMLWTSLLVLALFYPLVAKASPLLSPTDAQNMLATGQAVMIDVREEDEWRKQHIPDSINIPLWQLKHHVNDLRQYKRTLIIQCQRGHRSAQAANKLSNLGFKKIYNLDGGLDAWVQSGLPTE
jgi:rhodanese-related sulfurtransferase